MTFKGDYVVHTFTAVLALFFFDPSVPGQAKSVLFLARICRTRFPSPSASFLPVTSPCFLLPWIPINPITIREMLKCKWATSDRGRQGKTDDQRGYWSADERRGNRGEGTVQHDDTDTAERGRRGRCQAGSNTCKTLTFKQKNGGQWTLHCRLTAPHPSTRGLPLSKTTSAVIRTSHLSAYVCPAFCSHSVKCSFIIPIFRMVGCSLVAYPAY